MAADIVSFEGIRRNLIARLTAGWAGGRFLYRESVHSPKSAKSKRNRWRARLSVIRRSFLVEAVGP